MSPDGTDPESDQPAQRPRSFYLPQLDGLRFVAFLLVFVSHFQWAPHRVAEIPVLGSFLIALHRYGGVGVDLFLALSAFLITTLLLMEREAKGRVSLKDFYIRRTLRIWPLYYFAVLLLFVLIPWLTGTYAGAAHQQSLHQFGLSFGLFVGNMVMSLTDVSPPAYSGHLWTVSLEEQFYVIWPLAFVWMSGKPKAMKWFLIATLLFTESARVVVLALGIDRMIYTSFFTHLDPFALGALLAIVRHKTPARADWPYLRIIVGIAMICVALSPARLGAQSVHVVWQYPLLAIGFTVILDACVDMGDRRGLSILRSRTFVWLGKLSYGMYVYHLAIIACVTWAGAKLGLRVDHPLGWMIDGALSFAVTVTVAHASYQWLEKPFLRLKSRFTVVASRPA